MEIVACVLVFLIMIIIGMLFGRINVLVGLIFEGFVKLVRKLF